MFSQRPGDTRNFERELKFAVAPQNAGKLKSLPLLTAVRRSEQQLVSTYFDTAGRVLEKAGMSLRLRTSGDHIIQTLKWQAAPSGGLFLRSEYEIERNVPEPDLDYVRLHCPVRLRKELKGPLQPTMYIEVQRTEWPIRWRGGDVSVTLDEGVILGGTKSQPIHELEVEHRRGDVRAIFAVARQIAKAVPLRLEAATKSERGYRLAGNEARGPEKARPVKLDRSMTVISAFQVIASSCIHHFAVNEAVFVAIRDPEALHQMRVATRRLLSLISFCEELFSKQERATLDSEIRRAFKTLGRARDLDIVFMALTNADAREVPSAIVGDIRSKREAAYVQVIDMLTSQRFCLHMLDLLAFVECGSWAKAESASRRRLGRQNLLAGAARMLQRQWKRLGKFGRVSHLNAKRRHRLRIDAKTFRDTCEFLGDLFTGPKPIRRRKQLLKSLYALQDALGALNDRVSMEAILDREPGVNGAHLLKLAGLDEISERALLDSGGKAQRRLCKVTPFWV